MFRLKLPTFHQPFTPEPAASFDPNLIELIDVCKIYHSSAGEFKALNNVNLQVKAGEFIAIVGKSGSGKSTLINTITGIDHPSSGKIIIAGTNLHLLNEEQTALWRGQNIGVIFQFFQLLPGLTAVENIILPMDYNHHSSPAERPERAMQLLRKVGMEAFAHRFPGELSGGQQQTIAIARALANDPLIIVADEPTGNLDSKSTGMVFNLFEALAHEGKTIIMVTHDRDLAEQTHRIVTIADGQITGDQPAGVMLMVKEVSC
jgi:putative ABC transport system ATP-binding protein